MREAGFSSATVKSNLEEESALMPPPPPSSSPPPPPVIPSHFLLDPSIASGGGGGGYGLWPAQFLAAPAPGPVAAATSCNEDVRAVMEVMVRKQGRRSNPVVVGDSVSMAEAVAGELLRRLERGDVPEKLAGAHLLKLQLSYVHVRLMNRADVDARAAELRRSVDAVQLQRGGGGLVVYVGDLRWALDEEPPAAGAASPYSPVEHMVAELGRLLDDLRASRGRAWLVATASYQTYMRWQQRRRRPPPSLESAWALQAVVVPTGGGTGLALNSLHSSPSSSSPSGSATPAQPAMVTMQQLAQSPFATGTDTMAFAPRDEQEEKLVLCIECSKNYEREASLVKAEADAEGPRASLPSWLVPDRPPADQTPHKDKYLIELKRKWSRLCRKLHLCTDPCSAPCPWWSGSCLLPSSQCKPSIAGFLGVEGLMEHAKNRTSQWSPPSPSPLPRWGLSSLREPAFRDVGTALALGSLPLSDSATSPGSDDGSTAAAARELERRLRRNIPWQPGAVVAAIAGHGSDARKGGCAWLYLKGSDHAATRRAAAVIAETRCGSAGRVVFADPTKFRCAEEVCYDVVSRARAIGGGRFVLVVGDVERAPQDVVDCLVAASKSGSLKDQRGQEELDLCDSIVVLTTSHFANGAGEVISLRLSPEDEGSSGVLKRKAESPPGVRKRPRHDVGRSSLDLNLCAEEDSDEAGSDDGDDAAVPSDITHDGGDGSEHEHPHQSLLESVATRVVTLDDGEGPNGGHRAAAAIRARLAGVLDRAGVRVADDAAQALAAAAGHFLDDVLERWAAEVLEPAAAAAAAKTVKNGGKAVVVLGVGPSGGAREPGFMSSILPSRVHVD
uniref:SMAX1-like nucleotide binding domain-containing protein n=1 Tax=Arundo donax TaxID=35708 RepID=A0A0A9CQY1_ARUDO